MKNKINTITTMLVDGKIKKEYANDVLCELYESRNMWFNVFEKKTTKRY